jgi:hypothetical protein
MNLSTNISPTQPPAAQQVGGGPYAALRCGQQGWRPSPALIFFNEYALLKSDAPGGALHKTGGMTLMSNADCGGGEETATEWQLILKSETPFTLPRFIALPLTAVAAAFSFQNWRSAADPDFWVYHQVQTLEARFLRCRLDAGEWGLDNLTWDNANFPDGGLFADPDRFADLGEIAGGAESMGNYEELGPLNTSNGCLRTLPGAAAKFISGGLADAVSDHVYHGLALRLLSFVEFSGQHPDAGVDGYALTTACAIENLGAEGGGKGRAFVMADEFGAVNA